MTEEETVLLCRQVKSLCPAQTMDRFTSAAWYGVLGKYRYDDAVAAVNAVVQVKSFVSAADIIAELEGPEPTPIPVPFEELPWSEPDEPNEEFLAAKAELDEKMKRRDAAAMADALRPPAQVFAEQDPGERTAAHLDRHAGPSKYPARTDIEIPAADQWLELPGDPAPLRHWLAAQRRSAKGA